MSTGIDQNPLEIALAASACGQAYRQADAFVFASTAWVEAQARLRDYGVEPDGYSDADVQYFAGRPALVCYSRQEIERAAADLARQGLRACVVRELEMDA